MHAIKRTSRRGAARVYYVCNGWRVNGTCGNSWSLHLEDLDAGVLTALRDDVLTPDLVEDVVTRALELQAEDRSTLGDRRRTLEADLRKVDGELGRLAEAIATGQEIRTLVEAMRLRERRRADLQAQLEHVDGLARSARPTMTAELRARLRDRLASWDELLKGHPADARRILRLLLVGRVTLTPTMRPEDRFYEFTATASYGRVLAGLVAVVGLVPPEGFGRDRTTVLEGVIRAA
jgi:hypothetical protein